VTDQLAAFASKLIPIYSPLQMNANFQCTANLMSIDGDYFATSPGVGPKWRFNQLDFNPTEIRKD